MEKDQGTRTIDKRQEARGKGQGKRIEALRGKDSSQNTKPEIFF